MKSFLIHNRFFDHLRAAGRSAASFGVKVTGQPETGPALDALKDAQGRYGAPEIFNTDTGGPVYQKRLYTGSKKQPRCHQHG